MFVDAELGAEIMAALSMVDPHAFKKLCLFGMFIVTSLVMRSTVSMCFLQRCEPVLRCNVMHFHIVFFRLFFCKLRNSGFFKHNFNTRKDGCKTKAPYNIRLFNV